jgi:general stress protein 26
MTEHITPPGEVRKLAEEIRGIRFAMLTTVEADGTLRSRPMAALGPSTEAELWFLTRADSPKVDEIARERHVNLSYASPAEDRFVSVSGSAELVRDPSKARELWSPALNAWFPAGPDDLQLALLKVRVEHAERWDRESRSMAPLSISARPSLGEADQASGIDIAS